MSSSEHYYLVIEELNWGNAPGIFGEIFQLLDRSAIILAENSGESVYGINKEVPVHSAQLDIIEK